MEDAYIFNQIEYDIPFQLSLTLYLRNSVPPNIAMTLLCLQFVSFVPHYCPFLALHLCEKTKTNKQKTGTADQGGQGKDVLINSYLVPLNSSQEKG